MRWPWTKNHIEPWDNQPLCEYCRVHFLDASALNAHLAAEHADEIRAEFAALPTYEGTPMDVTSTTPPVSEPDAGAEHRAEDTAVIDMRDDCAACHGTGKVLTVRDYLDEIAGFLPTKAPDSAIQLDSLIAEFYTRLIATAPNLARLFPSDLATGDALNSKGHHQRDELLQALLALVTRYDPAHPNSDDMQALKTALAAWGRDHRDFDRGDGVRQGATPDEYLVVRNVLVGLLMDVVGTAWEVGHTSALADAYHFAMIEMLHAAQEAGPVQHPMPRRPRAAR